jgi:hypothetical protein
VTQAKLRRALKVNLIGQRAFRLLCHGFQSCVPKHSNDLALRHQHGNHHLLAPEQFCSAHSFVSVPKSPLGGERSDPNRTDIPLATSSLSFQTA